LIVSASYKTDIPAFYGEWFLNRLNAGHCCVVNPYNQRVSRIALDRASVDGIVFWTKNAGPFLKRLEQVATLGFPFMFQYTINAYPRELESYVIDSRKSIKHVAHISNVYGPRVVVWRYDTIVFSSLTDPSFHLRNFSSLASKLEGYVDEVVISFMHVYGKTERNLTKASHTHDFSWSDPTIREKRELADRLVRIAANHGLRLSVCSQKDFVVDNAYEARCVDADRLSDVAGRPIRAKLKGNRPECGCFETRDIGEYNTCPQGCVYCYAVTDNPLAKERFRAHDANSEFLFPPSERALASQASAQLPLL
jgi:hypothetical protein